jgi:hypothetical protein
MKTPIITLAKLTHPHPEESATYWAEHKPDRILVSHLTGGAPAFGAERIEEIKALADAHGWMFEVLHENGVITPGL